MQKVATPRKYEGHSVLYWRHLLYMTFNTFNHFISVLTATERKRAFRGDRAPGIPVELRQVVINP